MLGSSTGTNPDARAQMLSEMTVILQATKLGSGYSKVFKETRSAYDSATFTDDFAIKVDQPVGSMSISPCGRDVVLASKEGLHIVDLDNPYNPPRFLQHLTTWEVADVQWSPFSARDSWVISTSNQKALMWDLNYPSSNAVITVLHGHSRAITDINFSAHSPDQLATCSVDSFVHLWDMKTPQKPVLSFSDWFAGATQVKYNRLDEHIIASSHDKSLHIWDKRKGAYPLRSIEAHDTKIYGIDWNRTRATGIVTCSLDKAVKFWDYSRETSAPERVIRTNYPVWRARHTPFGWGLLTMPQRGDDDLYLYDRRATGDAHTEPVANFPGHVDQVKEFLWRSRGGDECDTDNREFQLVTWSKDQDIRLWEISPDLMRKVGHDPKSKLRFRLTRLGAQYRTFRREPVESISALTKERNKHSAADRVSTGPQALRHLVVNPISNIMGGSGLMSTRALHSKKNQLHKDMNPIQWMKGIRKKHKGEGGIGSEDQVDLPQAPHATGIGWGGPETLEDEITLVGLRFPKLHFEKVSTSSRSCLVSFYGPWGSDSHWVFLRCSISFTEGYPSNGVMPKFQIDKTIVISETQLETLDSQLKHIAESYLTHKRFCLEACMSYLLGERAEDAMYLIGQGGLGRDDSSSDDDLDGVNDEEGDEFRALIKINNMGSVPLPKVCGAMWSETGQLVCFFPPKEDLSKKPLIRTLVARDLAGSRVDRNGRRAYEAFGRIGNSYTVDRKAGAQTTSDLGMELSDEEDSMGSSSDHSTSSDEKLLRPAFNWRRTEKGFGRRRRGRNRSQDRSTQRSGGTNNLRNSDTIVQSTYYVPQGHSLSEKRANFIKIHDLSHLLPAKESLARAYAIYGNGPDVCAHNADVAEKHGFRQLSDVWNLARLILCNDVPLDLLEHEHKNEPILVVAKKASRSLKRRSSDSGIEDDDFAFDQANEDLYGRVKWGDHPFGGRWLVNRLMSHFENQADPQMLAMLACIFLEPHKKHSVPTVTLHLSQHEMPISMKSPAFSLAYHPDYIEKLSRLDPFTTPQRTPNQATPFGTRPGSFTSSNGGNTSALWARSESDPTLLYPMSSTPPLPPLYRGNTNESTTQSLSSSPEQHHNFGHLSQRKGTGIGNLAGNFARAFNTAQGGLGAVAAGGFGVLSGSPPQRRQHIPSPAESFTPSMPTAPSHLSSAVTWAPSTTVSFRPGDSTLSDTSLNDEDDDRYASNTQVDIQLFNLEQFDDESSVYTPLLDPAKLPLYRLYREVYADLLYIWDQQLSRLEILKFNGLDVSDEDAEHGRNQFARKKTDNWAGLDIGGSCTKCGRALHGTKGAKGECQRCHRQQLTLRCGVCLIRVKGLYAPCLKCGHVSHSECHAMWFTGRDVECPSGCGCFCLSTVAPDLQFQEIEPVENEDLDLVMVKSHTSAHMEGKSWESDYDDDMREEE